MEENNKYWLRKENRGCVLCKKGLDIMKHLVKTYKISRDWFKDLGENEEERLKKIWNDGLDWKKAGVLRKL